MGETRAVPRGCMDIPTEARPILSEATDASRQASSIGLPAAWSVAVTMWGLALQDLLMEDPCHHSVCIPSAADSKPGDATARPIGGCCEGPQETWWLRPEDLWHPWTREDP
jgi:hypothetical protein